MLPEALCWAASLAPPAESRSKRNPIQRVPYFHGVACSGFAIGDDPARPSVSVLQTHWWSRFPPAQIDLHPCNIPANSPAWLYAVRAVVARASPLPAACSDLMRGLRNP